MQRIVVFPDTNVFLQCKVLHDLPWKDVFDVDQVDLLVGAPVQDEIDRLKQDGNHRRARRARDTNNLFRQALDSSDEAVTIRENGPRVVLKFAPPLPVPRATPQTLDLTRADDRLIDEVRHYQNAVAASDVASLILTSDTGMKLRARRHNIAVTYVPDGWLLPPENDARDKEINKLKAELEQLRNAAPILDVTLHNGNGGEAITSLSAALQFYPPLSGNEVHGLIADTQAKFPRASDFGIDPPPAPAESERSNTAYSELVSSIQASLSSIHKWRSPTEDEIKNYQREYEEWIDKARGHFQRLASRLNASVRIIPLQLQLRNTGSLPADEVLLEFMSHDGLQLCISTDTETPEPIQRLHKLDRAVLLRPPPTAPKGEFVFSAFADIPRLGAHTLSLDTDSYLPAYPPVSTPAFNRDRHLFYRREDDESPARHSSFSCIELRHQSNPQIFLVWVIVPAKPETLRARLHFRVSARNLERPCELHIPVTIENKEHSTLEVAKAWTIKSNEKRMSLSDLAIPRPRRI